MKAIQEELGDYLNNDFTMFLVPPWLPNDERSPEQRGAHRLARHTFSQARQADSEVESDPRLESLRDQIAHSPASNEVNQLQAKLDKLTLEITSERRERLRKGEAGPVDPVMLDLFSQYSAQLDSTNSASNTVLTAQLVKRMGQATPSIDLNKGVFPVGMRSGIVSGKDTTLTLTWGSFTQLASGAPLFIDWLTRNGATDLKYNIASGNVLGSLEAE